MKLSKQLMLGLFCLTVNLAPLGALSQDEAGLIEEVDPWWSSPPRLVRFANDLLTVKVHDASVEELVEEVARQSGLNIVWYGTISERISLDFQGLSLDHALARILRHHSFALAFSQAGEGPSNSARPRKLWIIPKGAEGSGPQAAAANESEQEDFLQEESTDITLLIVALRSDDSWEREEAVEALGEIGGNSAIWLLEQALSDEYEGVRDIAEELLEELREDR